MATSVFGADVDGDGDLDVLSALFPQEIAWYENTDGAGSFGAKQVISTAASNPRSVFGADVDGDGDLDVLSASENDNKIAWYENIDGAGSFGAQQVISTAAYGPDFVIGSDVDGDGDLDVLSASWGDDKIAWYENTDGAGSFGAQQVISTAGAGPRVVIGSDVDGDGDLDVLSTSWKDDKIAWYENTDGAGSFGAQQVISTAVDNPRSVFGADVDGDGDLDVLSASLMDQKIAWYENTDGGGSFGAQQVISTAAEGLTSVFGADVDGDGDLDVLSAGDKIAWYENIDGAGSIGAQRVISTAASGSYSVFGADVDGDGDVDVLSFGDGKIAWYENTDGAGSFGAQPAQEADSDRGTSAGCLRFPKGFEGARDGVVDFDGDCVVVVDTNPQGATATAGVSSCDTPCPLNISETTKTITVTKEGYGSVTVPLQRAFHVFPGGSGFVFSPVSVSLTKEE